MHDIPGAPPGANRLGDRVRDWSRAAAQSERLADDFAEAMQRDIGMRVEP